MKLNSGLKKAIAYNIVFHNSYYSLHNFRKISYFLSFRKSGRTWVHNVLADYAARKYGCVNSPSDFSTNPSRDNEYTKKLSRKISFRHDFHISGINPANTKSEFTRSLYRKLPSLFLVRDPRDTLVSYYHHVIDRAHIAEQAGKTWWLRSETSIDDFAIANERGLKSIVNFLNTLALFSQHHGNNVRFYYYEDLRSSHGDFNLPTWTSMFNHLLQADVDADALEWALESNSFANMRQKYDAYKKTRVGRHPEVQGRIRSGKVGGYKNELSGTAQAFCNEYIERNLNSFFDRYKSH